MDTECLKEHCNNTEELRTYLREKAKRHNSYKYYASIQRILELKETRQLYLNNGRTWNDKTDRENIIHNSSETVNFARCFSFSREESIAMWMLYGGIDKRGGMIDFTKKGIQSILTVREIELGYFNEQKKFEKVKSLDQGSFEIYITDVIYYSKNKNKYFISRSDENAGGVPEEVVDKLTECKKVYPWRYENECRLIVSVPDSIVDEKATTVKIDLSSLNLGESWNRVYYAPNYPDSKAPDIRNSPLDGTVDWEIG